MSNVTFVLDEAASLGRMYALDDAVDKYRGYGVRLQFYYQSVSQLRKCFPDGQEQTLLSNVSQVFFSVNDLLPRIDLCGVAAVLERPAVHLEGRD